jgi:hypothetical protein
VWRLDDLTIAIPYQDHADPAPQSAVGLSLDRLPLRIPLRCEEHNLSKESLISHVRSQKQAALSHVVPYSIIRSIVTTDERELFDVMVTFNRRAPGHEELHVTMATDLCIETRFFFDEKIALFPCLVDATELAHRVEYRIRYKTSMVDQQVLEQFVSTFKDFIKHED